MRKCLLSLIDIHDSFERYMYMENVTDLTFHRSFLLLVLILT